MYERGFSRTSTTTLRRYVPSWKRALLMLRSQCRVAWRCFRRAASDLSIRGTALCWSWRMDFPMFNQKNKRTMMNRIWKVLPATLVMSAVLAAAGCEQNDESDTAAGDAAADLNAPLMVPAYPSMALQSIANTAWSSCEWNEGRG